jgi:hypothetical protein
MMAATSSYIRQPKLTPLAEDQHSQHRHARGYSSGFLAARPRVPRGDIDVHFAILLENRRYAAPEVVQGATEEPGRSQPFRPFFATVKIHGTPCV